MSRRNPIAQLGCTCQLGVGIVIGAIHVQQVDRNTIDNVVEARNRSVAARSYRNLARLQKAGSCEDLHSCRHFLSTLRLQDTVGSQLALAIEIRSKTRMVCALSRKGDALGHRAEAQESRLCNGKG
jgi:hypothetical protein